MTRIGKVGFVYLLMGLWLYIMWPMTNWFLSTATKMTRKRDTYVRKYLKYAEQLGRHRTYMNTHVRKEVSQWGKRQFSS